MKYFFSQLVILTKLVQANQNKMNCLFFTDKFSKLYATQKKSYEVLTNFGRYPQRNLLLKRRSTIDELKYLSSKSKTILLPTELSADHKVPKPPPKTSKKTSAPFQTLLFLHGSRQNANKIKNRLTKLRNMLKNECNAHITFLNGTHPYHEPSDTASESSLRNPIESQRVWYNPTSDSSIYQGLDEAYAHVLGHIRSRPAYDGIVGFSQGGVLAALIVKRNPELFRYFISISSYTPRCVKYKDMFSPASKCKYASLHVYGRNDLMVACERSIEFSRCFEESRTAEHAFGHFAPDVWPLEEICGFVREQGSTIRVPEFDAKCQDLDACISKLNLAMIRFVVLR